MPALQSITIHTPEGAFHIIVDENDVARVSGFGALEDVAKRLPLVLQTVPITPVDSHPYQTVVAAYFDGDPTALGAIPRTQTGSDFQQKVWQAISEIPYGQTITYKQLAAAAGNPAAVRAAGTTCGLNRLILLVPCHRVLRSDGGIGNYLYGTVLKTNLLQREGAITQTPAWQPRREVVEMDNQ